MTRLCSDKRLIAILILAFAVIYLTPLAGHHLLEPDEGRYSEIPREMVESGNYITPMLNYVKYFEKPVMLYWMNAVSFKVLGQNVFASRVPCALTALAGIVCTALLGAYMFGRRSGAISAVITGTSLLYYAIGTLNITDMPLSFFITLALASFYVAHTKGDKRWYLLSYAAMAFGTLTKGLAGFVLPGAVVFWYIVFTRKWRLIIDVLYLPGILLFFAIAAPWYYLVCRANPDFFHFFFIQEHFLRYATKMHNRYEPFWFYLPLIPAAVMPWTAFLIALLSKKSVVRAPSSPQMKDANIFLLTWFGVILLFFSFSGSKLIPYIVPCVPPLAILMACNADRMLSVNRWGGSALGWSVAIWILFSAAAFAYAFIGDELTPLEDIAITIGVSIGLLGGAFFAWRYTRRNDYEKAFYALCIGAIIFVLGLQTIYIPLNRTRSAWPVAKEIIATQRSGETIAVFDEVLQGLPFYTKQRVMLVDYTGELEFGARQKEGEGWFPSRDEFLLQWDAGTPFMLVCHKKRIGQLFPDGIRGARKEIKIGDYLILINQG